MNAQENNQLYQISEQLGVLKTKIDAVMMEQQNAANRRGEIYEEQHSIKRDIADVKGDVAALKDDVAGVKVDVADMKPVITKGKWLLVVFVSGIFGAGFTSSEVSKWLFKLLPLLP